MSQPHKATYELHCLLGFNRSGMTTVDEDKWTGHVPQNLLRTQKGFGEARPITGSNSDIWFVICQSTVTVEIHNVGMLVLHDRDGCIAGIGKVPAPAYLQRLQCLNMLFSCCEFGRNCHREVRRTLPTNLHGSIRCCGHGKRHTQKMPEAPKPTGTDHVVFLNGAKTLKTAGVFQGSLRIECLLKRCTDVVIAVVETVVERIVVNQSSRNQAPGRFFNGDLDQARLPHQRGQEISLLLSSGELVDDVAVKGITFLRHLHQVSLHLIEASTALIPVILVLVPWIFVTPCCHAQGPACLVDEVLKHWSIKRSAFVEFLVAEEPQPYLSIAIVVEHYTELMRLNA